MCPILGKDPYIKFCITTFSGQKMAKGEHHNYISSRQTENIICLGSVVCAVFLFSYNYYVGK